MPTTGAVPHTDSAKRPSLTRRLVGIALTVAVVVAVFVGIFPRFADYQEVGDLIRDLNATEATVLAVLAVWFLCAYWLVLMAALPSLRFLEAGVNHSTGTAVTNTVPTGGAIALGFNYAMYTSWGFSPQAVTTSLLTAGIFDNLVKWGLPVVALSLIALGSESMSVGWALPVLGAALLVATAFVIAAVLRSEESARKLADGLQKVIARVNRLLKRSPKDSAAELVFLRRNLLTLLGSRWRQLTLATASNHLAMFFVLFASLRFVGISGDELGLLAIVAGFATARLLSAVPITAGGLGVVDAGYVAVFSLTAPDSVRPALIAGVLLFRALTYLPPIALGLGSWIFWRSNTSWKQDWRTTRRGELSIREPDDRATEEAETLPDRRS